LLLVVIVGLLAAACANVPLDSSWGDMSLIGETPNILLSFGDSIYQIKPTDGKLVELLDADGDVRLDDQGEARLWRAQSPTSNTQQFYTRPLPVDDETLVAATFDNKLLQVDLMRADFLNENGVTLPGHVIGNPLLNGNLLYVPLSEGGIVAYDTSDDFSEVWRFIPENAKGMWSQPLLIEGTLYVSSMDHNLYALNPETGDVQWTLDLQGAIGSTPTYANGFLYVGSFANKVFKVTTGGSIVAEFTTKEWVWGAPAVIGDQVIATDLGGYVYVLRDSGDSLDEVWSRQVAPRAIRMTPLVTDDAIIVGSRDHFVYWVGRETGEEIFKRETRGEVLSDILLIEANDTIRDPMIVVSTIAHEELLVAFTLDQGERLWKYPNP
jgi:outer membrane protein assembly factor BamB